MSVDTISNFNQLSTGYSSYTPAFMQNSLYSNSFTNQNNSFGSLFQTPNYSNDIMMPSFKSSLMAQNNAQNTLPNNYVNQNDSTKETQLLNPVDNSIQNGSQPLLTGSVSQNSSDVQDIYNINKKLSAMNSNIRTTQNGNIYMASKSGKTGGILLGFASAVGSSVFNFLKSGSFSLKNLLIKAPVFAIAGFGAGAVADYFVNKNRAQKADKFVVA